MYLITPCYMEDWKIHLDNENYGYVLRKCTIPHIRCYSLYRTNQLEKALEECSLVKEGSLKYLLQAQIYYRKGDFAKAVSSYAKSEVSGSSLDINMQFLKSNLSFDSFEQKFNSTLIMYNNGNYQKCLETLKSIEPSAIEIEDQVSIKVQEALCYHQNAEYKKSIAILTDVALKIDAPFYISPLLKKLMPFIKIWPQNSKTSSKRQIKEMNSAASMIVPTAINLLNSISLYLSRHFVQQFARDPKQSTITKCKNASYLFKKCLNSNLKWLGTLKTFHSQYDSALIEIREVFSSYNWMKTVHSSISVDDAKQLRNQVGLQKLTFTNSLSNLDDIIEHVEVFNGKNIEPVDHHSSAERTIDPQEYMDLNFK
eukprot:NODE_485_length_6930_cov_0.490411.p3 type:complete len:369 gc:universal NODE_485_length_6930_cov_0.490411:6233-5127(-)